MEKGRLAAAVALCVVAIVAALYMGIHAFSQPKLDYPPNFSRTGPMGAHPIRTGGPGGTHR
jgi:hypothetical protein